MAQCGNIEMRSQKTQQSNSITAVHHHRPTPKILFMCVKWTKLLVSLLDFLGITFICFKITFNYKNEEQ